MFLHPIYGRLRLATCWEMIFLFAWHLRIGHVDMKFMRGKICYHGLVKYTIFIFYVSGMAVPIDQILWTKVNKSQSTLKNECTKTTVQKCANGFISKVKQNWCGFFFLIIINAILNLVLRTRVSAWIFLIYHNHYFWFDVILF